jgi:hypothetical protein
MTYSAHITGQSLEGMLVSDRQALGAWQTVIFRRDWKLFLRAVVTSKPVLLAAEFGLVGDGS